MLTFTFQFDQAAVDAYMGEVAATCQLAVEEAGEVVAAIAKEAVAIDTGSLMDTIDIDPIGPLMVSVNAGDTSGGYKGGGLGGKLAGTPVDYAIDQEYGSASVSGTPYMTPASEQGFQDFQTIAAQRLGAI